MCNFRRASFANFRRHYTGKEHARDTKLYAKSLRNTFIKFKVSPVILSFQLRINRTVRTAAEFNYRFMSFFLKRYGS